MGSGTACSSARCRTHPDREGCRSDPSPSAPPTRAAGSAQLEGSSSVFFFPGETLQGFPRSLEEPVPSCRARGGGEPGGKVTATKGHSAPKAAPCSSVPSAGEGRLQRAHSSVCSCTLRAGSALPGGFCFTSGVERLRKVHWWRLWLRPPAQPWPVWCGLRGAGFTSLLGEQNSALGAPGTEGCVRKGLRAAEVGTETSQVPTGAAGVGSPSLWASCKGRTRQRRAVPRCASIPPEKGVGQHLPRCPPFPQQRKA